MKGSELKGKGRKEKQEMKTRRVSQEMPSDEIDLFFRGSLGSDLIRQHRPSPCSNEVLRVRRQDLRDEAGEPNSKGGESHDTFFYQPRIKVEADLFVLFFPLFPPPFLFKNALAMLFATCSFLFIGGYRPPYWEETVEVFSGEKRADRELREVREKKQRIREASQAGERKRRAMADIDAEE